ncbi:Uncharacterised protein r2_g3127 [Pycnogonum litorale]
MEFTVRGLFQDSPPNGCQKCGMGVIRNALRVRGSISTAEVLYLLKPFVSSWLSESYFSSVASYPLMMLGQTYEASLSWMDSLASRCNLMTFQENMYMVVDLFGKITKLW